MGPAKRCSATELFTALTSPTMKQQVMTQLAADSITKKALSKEELKLYLDTPPAGRVTIEPPRGKTNNVVSEQFRHKPTCTSTEKS